MLNRIVISGTVGKEPALKYYETGKVKCSFSIAVNSFKNGQKVANWFDVDVWDKKAEWAAEYVKKGKSIVVEGHLYSHDYMGKTHWRITATKVNFSLTSLVTSGTIAEYKEIKTDKDIINNLVLDINGKQVKATIFGEKKDLDAGMTIIFNAEVGMVDNQPDLAINSYEVVKPF